MIALATDRSTFIRQNIKYIDCAVTVLKIHDHSIFVVVFKSINRMFLSANFAALKVYIRFLNEMLE